MEIKKSNGFFSISFSEDRRFLLRKGKVSNFQFNQVFCRIILQANNIEKSKQFKTQFSRKARISHSHPHLDNEQREKLQIGLTRK